MRETLSLPFKTNDGFFECWCKYGNNRLVYDTAYVAQVLDAREHWGVKEAVHFRPDGLQMTLLRVVSDDGGFNVMATTLSPIGPKLKVGDLVLWVPGDHLAEMGRVAGDVRAGFVGLITAVIDRVWSPQTGLRILDRFEPVTPAASR